jgi:hypothetical protein
MPPTATAVAAAPTAASFTVTALSDLDFGTAFSNCLALNRRFLRDDRVHRYVRQYLRNFNDLSQRGCRR